MFCKECGAEIPDNSKHCPECGAKLVNDAPVVETKKEEKESFFGKNKKKLVVCCIGLIVIFGIVALISNSSNHHSTSNHAEDNMSESDFKNNCSEINFNKVNKNADNFTGQKMKASGKVIQIMEDNKKGQMRLALDGSYSDVIYVTYDGSNDVVENDYVTVYGYCDGDYSYTSTIGASVTLPKIDAKYIEKSS